MTKIRTFAALAAALSTVAVLGACSSNESTPASGSSAASSEASTPVAGDIRVMAAASLTDVMDTFSATYGEENNGAKVQVDADASSALIERLKGGATADVLITADATSMGQAVEAGVAKDPVTIATNKLVIVVPKGNPGQVKGLDYFAEDGNRSVICASEVPCGRAAEKALAAIGEEAEPVSRASNVRQALASVTSGEANAALVYATDAASAGDKVETIDFENAPIVENQASALTPAGAAFVALLTSDKGKQILRDAGFGVA